MNRSIKICLLIIFINTLSFSVVIPILFGYSNSLGLNSFWSGFYFSCFAICQFVATPFLGKYADEYGKKRILLVCTLGTFLASLVQAITPLGWLLLVARCFDGVTGGNNTIARTIIFENIESSRIDRAIGLTRGAKGLGLVAGPMIAIGFQGVDHRLSFVCSALLALGATILGKKYLDEVPSKKVQPREIVIVLGQAFGDILYALGQSRLRLVFWSILITQMVAGLFYFGIQPLVLKHFLESQFWVNLILFVYGSCNAIATRTAMYTKTRCGRYIAFLWFEAVAAISLLVMPFHFALFLIASCGFCYASTFLIINLNGVMVENAQPQKLGIYQGIFTSLSGVGVILGPVIGGAILQISKNTYWLPMLVGSSISAILFLIAYTQPNLVNNSSDCRLD